VKTTGTENDSIQRGLAILKSALECRLDTAADARLIFAAQAARAALAHAEDWLLKAMMQGETQIEAGARRFALTLGRTMELALLVRHAQWSLVNESDERAVFAVQQFIKARVDLISD
jgi:hypothetical protein